MKLRAIKNHILFKFIDKTDSKGQFVEETKWGLQITGSSEDSAKLPRWGVVVDRGPDCWDVESGQQILIHALKWTSNFKLGEEKMWRTDETQVAVVRRDENAAPLILGKNILFQRLDKKVSQSQSGLYVVGQMPDTTPHGRIIIPGPDCDSQLKLGTVIFFDDTQLFSKFTYNGTPFWYINEDEVLAFDDFDNAA